MNFSKVHISFSTKTKVKQTAEGKPKHHISFKELSTSESPGSFLKTFSKAILFSKRRA